MSYVYIYIMIIDQIIWCKFVICQPPEAPYIGKYTQGLTSLYTGIAKEDFSKEVTGSTTYPCVLATFSYILYFSTGSNSLLNTTELPQNQPANVLDSFDQAIGFIFYFLYFHDKLLYHDNSIKFLNYIINTSVEYLIYPFSNFCLI